MSSTWQKLPNWCIALQLVEEVSLGCDIIFPRFNWLNKTDLGKKWCSSVTLLMYWWWLNVAIGRWSKVGQSVEMDVSILKDVWLIWNFQGLLGASNLMAKKPVFNLSVSFHAFTVAINKYCQDKWQTRDRSSAAMCTSHYVLSPKVHGGGMSRLFILTPGGTGCQNFICPRSTYCTWSRYFLRM